MKFLKKIKKIFMKKRSELSAKELHELSFQKGWAAEFKKNKGKVLEYWKKYRYLDDINFICKIDKTKKILDVGCGISTVLHFLRGKKYGVDPLADEYKKLYKYPEDITIDKNFGERINHKSNFFDVVFCSNVIDHVEDISSVMSEIHRVLKTGGFFVLTVEVHENEIKRNEAHPHCITKDNLDSLVSQDKFDKIFQEETEWISLRGYVNGSTSGKNKEVIMIWKKK